MTVGWYVHHHGAGHLHRFLAVRPHLDEVVGLSSLPAPDDEPWVQLPLDLPAPASGAEPDAGGILHWAPLRCDGLRARMAALAAWIESARPSALVVDVSVEVALLARLLGVPTVVVAQRGVRIDEPHRLAYASASAVVAPWTAEAHLPGEGPPDERLVFTGAISRFDRFAAPPEGSDVVVLLGGGGHGVNASDISRAAAADGRCWHVAGPLRVEDARVVDHGPRADVWSLLQRAAVVVGSAGGNVVAEVAAARRPFVCLPQDRPFAEQHRQAEALRRLGVASVHERWPRDWDRAVDGLDPSRWALLHDGHGAKRFARAVREVACA